VSDGPEAGLSQRALPPLPPGWALRAGVRLRSLLHRAVDKLVPAQVLVFERVTSLVITHALGSVARLRIADALDDGPKTAGQLAMPLELDADALHRTLRLLTTAGIFRLRSDGRFEHTRRSRVLRSVDPSRTREAAEYFTGAPNASAYMAYDGWLKTGESPYETQQGMTVFERFAKHPDEGAVFDQLMMGITLVHARMVARLYPFSEVRRLCDVGGGRGTLLSELLLHHAHLHGVLYDAPAVVESAQALLAHRGVLSRVERLGGSFFEKVPAACDAYLLKNVLHDWDDETCVKLLRNVRAACGPGARVLVVETLLEPNQSDPYGATADVHMGVVCTGRERSRADYAQLFARSGLTMGRVFDGSAIAVIEAIAK
jgi:C-methyltransferase